MGTNFYCKIIPTKQRKNKIKELIDSDDFSNIKKEVENTYGRFNLDWEGNPVGGVVHLGKRSAGWKFLWNPNVYLVKHGHMEWEDSSSGHYVQDPNTAFYLYPLTKQGIREFIMKDNIKIYDEYGEYYEDKEEWFKEAVNWVKWKDEEAWDSKTYTEFERKNHPYWKVYKCTGEYIDLLKSEGIKFISEEQSDFYSDGLRFASNTEFS